MSFWRRLGLIALVAVAYFSSAAFGLSLALLSKQVSSVWPPTGIALAALLILGRWVWPGITIGALTINALYGPFPSAMGIAVGNTLEAVVGAELLKRYVGFRCAMDRPSDVIGLTVCSALVSTIISATLGVVSLCLNSVEPWSHCKSLWWTWWLGDAMGALIVAPPLLIGAAWVSAKRKLKHPLESAFFIVAVTIVSYLVLGGSSQLDIKYLVIPLFVWSSLRLGQVPTAAGLTLAAGFVIYWITSASSGAKSDDFNAQVLVLQSFLGVLFVGSLTLGAEAAERERISIERDTLLKSERAARAEAERMARQKDDFVATLAHEFRTPLTGLLGWVQVLMRGRRDAAVVDEGLRAVDRGARALSDLMDDLIDMTRVMSGKMSLRLQPVDLAESIDNAVDILRPAADSKNIDLTKVIQTNSVVLGDGPRLRQVLCNLISNAVKFTPSSGRVEVRLTRENGNALIAVQDTGLGIKPDFLPHVFDRFRQADSSSTRRFGGLGLGLAIVKHIVQLHGGRVTADSRGQGEGATFTICIPVADEQLLSRLPETSLDEIHLSGRQILILDDDLDACETLRRMLSEFGAVVTTAHTADMASRLISNKTQLLLCNIGLPDRDGYQLMRDIRRHHDPTIRCIPAIAVTAFARPEDRERALDAGFDAHVSKPVDFGELLAAIARVLSLDNSFRLPASNR